MLPLRPAVLSLWKPVFILFCIGFLTQFGCSGQGSLYPVEGKVLVDGKPLTSGHVVYYPDKEKGNDSSALPEGDINSDGSYKLMTRGNTGAPMGWYKVGVTASSGTPDSSKPLDVRRLVAEFYGDVGRTPLKKEVKASASPGDYDLNVSAK